MATKEAYQEKVEAKLKKSQAEIERLKAQASEAKADAKLEYEKAIDKIAEQQKAAEQKLQEVKQAGGETWQELSAEVQGSLAALQESFNNFNKRVKTALSESVGWPEGLADKKVVDSIGWAEGISEEDPVKSSGWSEGMTEAKIPESEGWTEGYEKEKEK